MKKFTARCISLLVLLGLALSISVCAAETQSLPTSFSAPVAYYASVAQQDGNDVLDVKLSLPGDLFAVCRTPEDYGCSGVAINGQLYLSMSKEQQPTAEGDAQTEPTVSFAIDHTAQLVHCERVFSFGDESVAAILGNAVTQKTNTKTKTQTADFDEKNATLYTYARLQINLTKADGTQETVYSPWTGAFAVGKEGSALADVTSFSAPILGEAVLVGEDPQTERELRFDVRWGDGIQQANMYRAYNGKGYVTAMAVLNVNREEKNYIINDLTQPLQDGTCTLNIAPGEIPANAMITLKVFVFDGETLYSDYSNLSVLKIQPADAPEVSANDTVEKETQEVIAEEEQDTAEKCSVCGICPAPFGICLFLLLGGIVILILAIAAIAHFHRVYQKKECPRCHTKCAQQEKVCPNCQYRFTTVMPLEDDGD